MTAQMTIDQVGLSAGVAGRARTDGLDTGAQVTLTSVGGGSTHRFELLWVPLDDTSALSTLGQTAPTVYKFTPTALVHGTYRIHLVVDEGLPTESHQIRVFRICDPILGLATPAANEKADPQASLANATAAVIDHSEDNEIDSHFGSGRWIGWYLMLDKLVNVVRQLAGGGYHFEDDFEFFDTTNRWATTVVGGGSVTRLTSGNPPDDASGWAWVQLTSGAGAGDHAVLNSRSNFRAGSGPVFATIVKLPATLANATLQIGLATSSGSALAMFQTTVGGAWQTLTAHGFTTTTHTLGTPTPVANAIVSLRIEVAPDASKVQYYINGILVDTVTSNVPSGNDRLAVGMVITQTAGGGGNAFADLFDIRGGR